MTSIFFAILCLPFVFAQKPSFGLYNEKIPRNSLARWLLIEGLDYKKTTAELPPFDGWYNNLAMPDIGAIDRPLLRRWPAAYEDGTYQLADKNRPNPFKLSSDLLKGAPGTRSQTGKNVLLVYFGQQIVEEILDSQRPACPPEYINIKIPSGHKFINLTTHSEMPLLRTRYDSKSGVNPSNPRQQLNENTPFIDGGVVYGKTKQWSDQLRTYGNGVMDPDGLLASSHNGLFPERNKNRLPLSNPPPPFFHSDFIQTHSLFSVQRLFKLGNSRGNETPFLLTFGILWFRWHNYLARNIRTVNVHWTSDEVFNEARKWVIATQQHIILDEWLPAWVGGNIPEYTGYDAGTNPQIDQFFQAAAGRYGHTLVTPAVYMRDYGRNKCRYMFESILGANSVRTCNSFWRPDHAITAKYDNMTNEFMDIDRFLMGMTYQLCEAEDHKVVEDLRDHVFGPLEFPRRDLMAINIQRGRDHGLPDYNSARMAYGLPPMDSFNQFPVEPKIIERLTKLYKNNINDIDVWVGGLLETNQGPGELFERIIIDQFRRIRDGDRFWYENGANKLFTQAEINRIKDLTLYDIIMAVTKMDPLDLQKNVYNVPMNTRDIHPNCIRNVLPGTCSNRTNNTKPCYHLPILNKDALNERCRDGSTYDYFTNSEVSFILTFAGVSAVIAGIVGLVFGLIYLKQHPVEFKKSQTVYNQGTGSIIITKEWVGKNDSTRLIIMRYNNAKHHIEITSFKGTLLRSIDCTRELLYQKVSDKPYLIIRPLNEYDLVLLFESDHHRDFAIKDIIEFSKMGHAQCQETIGDLYTFKKTKKFIITKDVRQKQLDLFFRVVVSQAFRSPQKMGILSKLDHSAENVMKMELTLVEFADFLNMTPEAVFVNLMFNLVDKDKNGFISFRELIDLMAIFAEGSAADKAQLLFNMYDIKKEQMLSKETFKEMLKSFLDIVKGNINNKSLDNIINTFVPNKKFLTFSDFLKITDDYKDILNDAKLGFKYPSHFSKPGKAVRDAFGTADELRKAFETNLKNTYINFDTDANSQAKIGFITIIEKYCQEIFWMSLYTFVLFAIFAERIYVFAIEREHSGIRKIVGPHVAIARGSGSAIMFTYSSLLVTMCRNLNTKLRETFANKYFPFDASVEFHKYIAYWAFIFTIIHIIAHAFNFYQISTQAADDLTCLFPNFFHSTHQLPKFHYWCWETITGVTGILLTIIMAIIYTFAIPVVRMELYRWFWYTHSLYPVFFILMLLHGTGRLLQGPFLYYFFLGPVILFAIDQVISLSRNKIEVVIESAKILPSSVTMLEIRRPINFEYKSGQWVRIACLDLNGQEYHPFTLSSSPDETNLTLHIRTVGPWTTNMRNMYDNVIENNLPLPKIYLDGPFGEGHQDWHQYEASILIGGGIGVTPFASILKDITYKGNTKQLTCKKVYFIWISRTQKEFEWLVDMLRDIETRDQNRIIDTHIYITQFYEKFDLRTIMLYVFERHYQKLSNKSLFTNLKAITHFGRPNFNKVFKTIQDLHYTVPKIAVFSCGGPRMISSIDAACINVNKSTFDGPILEHRFSTF